VATKKRRLPRLVTPVQQQRPALWTTWFRTAKSETDQVQPSGEAHAVHKDRRKALRQRLGEAR
jgi:hypothetical protein